MKQIGARIRVLREKQGLTQQELADRLQVTRQTVSNYEIGRSQPDLEMLEQLANVLNVDIALLLGNGQTSVRVPVRSKLEQIRSGERFPWGAIIAFLLVMPFVYILWAAFVASMGLYTMAWGMLLPFFLAGAVLVYADRRRFSVGETGKGAAVAAAAGNGSADAAVSLWYGGVAGECGVYPCAMRRGLF